MPALPPVPQVIRAVLHYTYGIDTTIMNRFYVKYSGAAPDNTGLTTWAGVMSTAWNTNMAPMCTSVVSLTSVVLTDLTTPTAAQGTSVATHAGSRVGGVLGAQTAALIDFHVQRRYRGGKPRIYLPCGSGTDLNNAQTWSTAFQSALQNAFNNFYAAWVASPPVGLSVVGQVSVSYYQGFTVHTGSTGRAHNVSTPRATPVVDTVTAGNVDPRLGTQRRRARP